MVGPKKSKTLDSLCENKLFELESSLAVVNDSIGSIRLEGKSVEEKIAIIDNVIQENNGQVGRIEVEIEDLKKQIISLSIESEKHQEIVKNKKHENALNAERSENLGTYFGTALTTQKSIMTDIGVQFTSIKKQLKSFASKHGVDRSHKSFGPSLKPKNIVAIGDLHGWAPGLINIIHETNSGRVKLLNSAIETAEHLNRRFPNPMSRNQRNLPFSQVGLNNHPARLLASPSMYDGLDVDLDEATSDDILVQVGDIIDRGDHSELALEILRSLLIKQPGRSISLLGNHEVWILEHDLESWMRNEERYRMTSNKPGSLIHDPRTTGIPSVEDSMKNNFAILQGALGAFLLTQHYSFRQGLSNIQQKQFDTIYASSIGLIGVRNPEKSVLKGGWALHSVGKIAMESWNLASKKDDVIIPGGFACLILGDTAFAHAEPSEILHSKVDTDDLQKQWDWHGLKCRFLPTKLSASGIKDSPLYYARTPERTVPDKWAQLVGPHLAALQRIEPSLVRYCHGHTAIGKEPIKQLNINGNNFEVVNCDMSMTPYYRHLRHDDAYDPTVIPFYHRFPLSCEPDLEGE